MDAIHAPDVPDVPEKMRGLTLFATDKSGTINYSTDKWYGITAKNSMQHRKDVLDFDWSDVAFILTDKG